MTVFRKNFLREEEIGIIPSGGYRNADIHEKLSVEGARTQSSYNQRGTRIRNWWQEALTDTMNRSQNAMLRASVSRVFLAWLFDVLSDELWQNAFADRNDTIDACYSELSHRHNIFENGTTTL